jgi:hypothetical protein
MDNVGVYYMLVKMLTVLIHVTIRYFQSDEFGDEFMQMCLGRLYNIKMVATATKLTMRDIEGPAKDALESI